jgi:hypothetical protein
MATVTVASVGSSATTVAELDGNGLVLDVFPAYFPVTFGVEVDGAVTTAEVG